ncbi:MAG: hypothetical protein PVH87_15005 [Desulfobacteraceae bacterium]|jgi:hypothetical protein
MIAKELRAHTPFTALGTISGILIMALIICLDVPNHISAALFWMMHPAHVLLSALVTAAIYRLHAERAFLRTLLLGYMGSLAIASLSDCIIPYFGEWLLQLPNRGIHIGAIEKWWLVNPLAIAGATFGFFWPKTRFPHGGHVFLSTWASLFHITMALGTDFDLFMMSIVALFLFLAVWIPCCTSDIVFPLLFARKRSPLKLETKTEVGELAKSPATCYHGESRSPEAADNTGSRPSRRCRNWQNHTIRS